MSDALVNEANLERYLKEHAPDYSGPFEVERIGEGQSCLTFLVAGDGWQVVLRRPPRGDLPPSAFDVTREYRVMRGLHDHAAPVPVPGPILLCEDKEIIGAPFYLMDKVDGVVIRSFIPDSHSSVEDRRRMGEELVDTLIQLHSVDFRAVGLEGFGKPDGYLERQLRRMNQLWGLAKSRELPEIDEVGAWLEANMPKQSRPAIIHGDYKLDNVILAPERPASIAAVVDWEMSTIGDPLADLGWMLYFWRDPGDPDFGLRASSVTDMDGFLRRKDILERYARSFDVPVELIRWYVALGGWKIAIIMEGSYKRFQSGVKDHPMFAFLDQAVPGLAKRALEAARGEFAI